MASDFKNAITADVAGTFTECYKAPVGTTATLIGLSVANVGDAHTFVDVVVNDSSTSVEGHIGKHLIVPLDGTLIVVGGDQKVVLEPQDSVKIKTDGGHVDVIISVLEAN